MFSVKKMNKNKQPTLLSYEHDMSEVELHKYSYEDEILLNLSINFVYKLAKFMTGFIKLLHIYVPKQLQ